MTKEFRRVRRVKFGITDEYIFQILKDEDGKYYYQINNYSETEVKDMESAIWAIIKNMRYESITRLEDADYKILLKSLDTHYSLKEIRGLANAEINWEMYKRTYEIVFESSPEQTTNFHIDYNLPITRELIEIIKEGQLNKI